jgi:hypothetical protein
VGTRDSPAENSDSQESIAELDVFEIKKIQKGNNVLLATYTGKLVGKTLSGRWSTLDDRYKGEFNYKQQR